MLGELQGPLPCVEELCPVQRQALGGTDTSLFRDHGHRHASPVLSMGQIQSKELLPKVRGRGRLPLRQAITALECLEDLL